MKVRYKFQILNDEWKPTEFIIFTEKEKPYNSFEASLTAKILIDHIFTTPMHIDLKLKCVEVERLD